jgi:hypothetical protein
VRYELFLRRSAPLTEQMFAEVRGAVEQEGHGALKLDPYHTEGGSLAGFDLGVDPNQPAAAALLCRVAFRMAEEQQLGVYDPQLGRAVTVGDEELIGQQLEQNAAFVMAAPVTPTPEGGGGLSPTLRLWLIIIGLVVAAFVLIRAASCALR